MRIKAQHMHQHMIKTIQSKILLATTSEMRKSGCN